MKSLVAYYSRTGNTKKVAALIAADLAGDIEEIVDVKDRAGFLGYIGTVWDTIFKHDAEIEALEYPPEGYDLVVVGTPIWNWGVAAAVRTYLCTVSLRKKCVAFFCTGENGEAQVFVQMADLAGARPIESGLITEKSMRDGSYVPQARAFAAKLKSHFGVV